MVAETGNVTVDVKPVTYEIVLATFYQQQRADESGAAELKMFPQQIYVRQKGSLYSGGYGSSYTYEIMEVKLEMLLTNILQSLEKLGIDVVIKPAVSAPASIEFKKRQTSTETAP